jgi:hypothetical protein
MRSSAIKIENNQASSIENNGKVAAFARELSELCRKYGLAISGDPTIFVMEPGDYAINYGVNEASKLIWGYEA